MRGDGDQMDLRPDASYMQGVSLSVFSAMWMPWSKVVVTGRTQHLLFSAEIAESPDAARACTCCILTLPEGEDEMQQVNPGTSFLGKVIFFIFIS